MSHRLLNRSEEATFQRLWKLAEKNWAHVDFKIRLKDAIPVEPGGVSYADFSFALKAHLDFLVYDAFFHPLFAVEFDGPTHETDPQQQRCDRRKDALLKRFGLPLLRINAKYLNRKFGGFDLLSYFIEDWFWCDSYLSYLKAKEARGVSRAHQLPAPPELTLSPSCLLNREIGAKIEDLCKTGQLHSLLLFYWNGQDNAGGYRCIMWSQQFKGRDFCFVESHMRPQQFPLNLSYILQQITTFDLLEQIQSVICGERATRTDAELEERLDYYASHFALLESDIA